MAATRWSVWFRVRIYNFDTLRENLLLKDVDAALAIGVFDGVHLGHREIFTRLAGWSREHAVCSAAVTFGTNPKIRGLAPLDTMRLRAAYMESFSIDYMLVIDFSADFSKMSGREFIRLLCTMCRPKAVIVGEDFKCGCPSDQITADELSGAFAGFGCSVEVVIIPPVLDPGRCRISSTHIRSLISSGDVELANRLSGSCYRYDLVQNSFAPLGGSYVTSAVTTQRLPADGLYRSRLVLLDKSEADCLLEVRGRELKLSLDSGVGLAGADSIRILYKEK